MKINKLFESFAPIELLRTITQKKFWVKFLTLLYDISLPLLSAIIIINMFICIMWFVAWSIPENFYIPFTGGRGQDYFERALVLIGIVMRFTHKRLYK